MATGQWYVSHASADDVVQTLIACKIVQRYRMTCVGGVRCACWCVY